MRAFSHDRTIAAVVVLVFITFPECLVIFSNQAIIGIVLIRGRLFVPYFSEFFACNVPVSIVRLAFLSKKFSPLTVKQES